MRGRVSSKSKTVADVAGEEEMGEEREEEEARMLAAAFMRGGYEATRARKE